jgi:MarR family transcriptional regulator, organic hydroperoxide resistance regulator
MDTRTKNLQDLFATSALTQRMMHACMQRAFEELGIAPSQMHLLQLIEHSQPVSLKKLADDMRLTPGAITQLVDGLVETGYLERTPSSEDRRVTVVALTTAGTEKIGLLKRKKQALLTKVVADLDDDELQVFLRVQQKMLAYLETSCRNIKK